MMNLDIFPNGAIRIKATREEIETWLSPGHALYEPEVFYLEIPAQEITITNLRK